ncbi:alpha/beta hydrolase family protein [Flavobacterium psychrotrophum]|uniref:alpha/beta hydrolase family protein n=1 Tax=Flavobacterium psychrotrophum TaxID=2294119 RepID=UPI0013C4798E|nr:prolyl oligopeptidase family serine peptidase [Flavobacterium psychrotrophum]
MIFSCVMLLGIGTVPAQEKPCLTQDDYSLWGTTQLYGASDDARWAAYHTRFENGKDTLTLQQTQTGKRYHYPQGASVLFAAGGLALVRDALATLYLKHLDSGSQQAFKNVKSYGLNADSSHLFMLQNDTLSVIRLTTNIKRVIPGVTAYTYNTTADALAYTVGLSNQNQVGVLHLSPKGSTNPIIAAESTGHVFANLVWSKRGGEIAFERHPLNVRGSGTKGTIGFYHLKGKAFFEFDAARHPDFPKDKIISCTFLKPLSISDDGSKVFFGIVADTIEEGNPIVDIWNTADKFIHPAKEEIRNWDAVAKVAVWWPATGRFYTPVHNDPATILTGDQKAVLSFDPGQYEPQNNFRGPVDITLTFLETGEQKKILEKWAYSPPYLQVSPMGRCILYQKGNHWWVYDITKDTHRNLTLAVADSGPGSGHQRAGTPALGFAGWSSDDTAVFVYSPLNIWKLDTDGSSAIRLTKSNGASIFRFASKPEGKVNMDGYAPQVIDTGGPIAVKEYAHAYTSFYTWQQKKGLTKIVTEAGEIANVIPCKTNKSWMYVFHNYQVAPTVRLTGKHTPKTVYSSNTQQEHFAWGRAELIGYEDSSGNKLKGILYYPAGYNPSRKYPMVVHIYETQSHGFFDYINPSLYNHTGFNITNLVAQGYFVLLPDITYQIGDPGYSALDCTRAAVQKTFETVPVEPNRVGLVGHSWGGYQTNYIISKTVMFKTAVAGAAITDLRSNYFTVAWNNYIPNYYQSESDQVRLGTGYYDNPELYIKNSPLSSADKITTPLLSWAGKQDKQVDVNQTIQLHMALRRLGKRNIMLLYPHERHVLMQKEHQEDLTWRTESWLAHYLKGEAEPSWCKADKLK